jgi:hypothetical protein
MQADPSEICFLDEVLYWAAFQRLPQPFPNIDGNDFRSSSMPGYEVNCAYGGFADDEWLPPKKEAGIAHVQNWFVKRMGKPPSRAAISEKLTPYYERFVKNAVMKTAS